MISANFAENILSEASKLSSVFELKTHSDLCNAITLGTEAPIPGARPSPKQTHLWFNN